MSTSFTYSLLLPSLMIVMCQSFVAIAAKRHLSDDTRRRLQYKPQFRISREAFEQIRQSIGKMPAERGGMLGGSRTELTVRHFHFDAAAQCSGGTYSPDTSSVNQLLREDWNPNDVNLLGFVHSHPPGFRSLSGGDVAYAERILERNPDLRELFLPIVISEADTGRFELIPFAVVRSPTGLAVEEYELHVIDDVCERVETPTLPEPVSTTYSRDSKITVPLTVWAASQQAQPSIRPLSLRYYGAPNHDRSSMAARFRNVENDYDLEYLADCRMVYVGCGGVAAFTEKMVRAGVGEHILIDGNVVSESDIATQQVYGNDIGRPKVDCIAGRLADINPTAGIAAYCNMLDDFTDEQFEELVLGPMPYRSAPKRILLCGLTDSFPAQARINRLALKFGLPSLCAQVYHEGRGAEVTFTFPGITTACHRCMLSSRYKAYLDDSFENNVTSYGTPICSTSRLNALIEEVALSSLHYGTEHPRWGQRLKRIGNRNPEQTRIAPGPLLPVFGRIFLGADDVWIVSDEAVWSPQTSDCPENGYPTCPDCGGTGDLKSMKGAIIDTRELPHTLSVQVDETCGSYCPTVEASPNCVVSNDLKCPAQNILPKNSSVNRS